MLNIEKILSKQSQVLLICNNQYLTGVFTGYFHTLGERLISVSDNNKLSEVLKNATPNLVFFDLKINNGGLNEELWQALLQRTHVNNIPICGLGSARVSKEVEQALDIEFDSILIEPINLAQLSEYVIDKLNFRVFYHNSRVCKDRRVLADRRCLPGRRSTDIEYSEKPNAAEVAATMDIHSVGPFLINNKLKCVYFNGKLIPLTNKEYKLFRKLACDSDRVISDEELIDYLWPGNSHATKADLHQYMYLLRKKIESDPKKPKWITTVSGFGYRLECTGGLRT